MLKHTLKRIIDMEEIDKKEKVRKGDIEAYFNISVYIIPMIMVILAYGKRVIEEMVGTILLLVIVIATIITFKMSIEIYNIKRRIGDLNDNCKEKK